MFPEYSYVIVFLYESADWLTDESRYRNVIRGGMGFEQEIVIESESVAVNGMRNLLLIAAGRVFRYSRSQHSSHFL
jgi:hypothetical protein